MQMTCYSDTRQAASLLYFALAVFAIGFAIIGAGDRARDPEVGTMKRRRIVLSEFSFRELIAGGVVADYDVEIILADIGFDRMRGAIATAESNRPNDAEERAWRRACSTPATQIEALAIGLIEWTRRERQRRGQR